MDSTEEDESSKQESTSDMIGVCDVIKQCEACLQVNISVEATLFCTSCTEFLCDECKSGHVRYKRGKHDFVGAKDSQIKSITVDLKGMDACEEHSKKVKFFCKDHSLLCCSTCAFSHRKCENINELVKISGDSRPKLQNLKDTLAQAADNERNKVEGCKQTVHALNFKLGNLQEELDKMKEEINKLFDETSVLINKEAKCAVDIESKRLGERQSASEAVLHGIVEMLPLCSDVLDNGTPQHAFILTKYLKKKLQEINVHDKKQRNNHFALDLSLDFSTELTNLLQKRSDAVKLIVEKINQGKDEISDGSEDISSERTCTTMGSLVSTDPTSNPTVVQGNLSPQSRPVNMMLLVFLDLPKTGDDEYEPLLTGLDFLPDGRLVALDNQNKKCIILNEQLQRIGTPYKFTGYPYCVVCVSHDALCVTFGGDKVVRLLSVSTDNTIRLTREIKTSSTYFSICCMSPSHMVVSTRDGHRPVRMLSVDGIESEFDNLDFPTKTYTFVKSMCTYVQSKNTLVLTDRDAHTVFLYDTVKGTSQAVTNENIKEPRGVCVGPSDTVLVCSQNKNSIVHLTIDGAFLGTYPVDMKVPYSICMSKDGSRLAVFNSKLGARKLHLYKISPEMS